MGIGHGSGFSSILVPGCGEPNFDALEVNPYQNKKQRREAEVKALLEKIPAELITLNPRDLAEVNLDKLNESVETRKAKLHLKPERIEFEPKNKTRGRSGTVKKFHVKRTVQEEAKWVRTVFFVEKIWEVILNMLELSIFRSRSCSFHFHRFFQDFTKKSGKLNEDFVFPIFA